MKNKTFDNTSRILLNKLVHCLGKMLQKIDYKNINLLKDIPLKKEKFFQAELRKFLQKNKNNYHRLSKEQGFLRLYLTYQINA